MLRYHPRQQALAVCLAALAGYVDAVGFLQLGGFFVSFMSGNSTRLAVGLARGTQPALVAAGLIGGFVTGVVMGTLAGRAVRPGFRTSGVMGLVAVLLAVAALLQGLGAGPFAAFATVLAMGAENAVFERDGEVSVGVTYMTGTLVKLGQRLAFALVGGDRLAWIPYLFLWVGLLAGATLGALAFPVAGTGALWPASAAAFGLAAATFAASRRALRRSALPGKVGTGFPSGSA